MTISRNINHHMQALAVSVSNLAAPASDQIAYLASIGFDLTDTLSCIDELALEFDDDFMLASSLLKAGAMSPDQYQRLRALSDKLDDMSGQDNATLWTRLALTQSPHWEEVRALAQHYLSTLRPHNDA